MLELHLIRIFEQHQQQSIESTLFHAQLALFLCKNSAKIMHILVGNCLICQNKGLCKVKVILFSVILLHKGQEMDRIKCLLFHLLSYLILSKSTKSF